ncbi:unnamed protein product [Brugia timori]|uniref:Uncharacterized protein n=1 Tax=Brugia timori TaxID=42155 RepID=A0A3P7Y4N4_9BILA|nr:unnamed protein product [Brugia timori]
MEEAYTTEHWIVRIYKLIKISKTRAHQENMKIPSSNSEYVLQNFRKLSILTSSIDSPLIFI